MTKRLRYAILDCFNIYLPQAVEGVVRKLRPLQRYGMSPSLKTWRESEKVPYHRWTGLSPHVDGGPRGRLLRLGGTRSPRAGRVRIPTVESVWVSISTIYTHTLQPFLTKGIFLLNKNSLNSKAAFGMCRQVCVGKHPSIVTSSSKSGSP